MLIPIPILIDLCPHLVASMTAVHENLSGGLQTLKYCIYVYFDNRPVYEASLLSLWKHTTVCKISLCISCWIKNSWVLSPESYILYPKSFSSAVNNVKVIPNEECGKQHHMVVCNFTAHTPHVKKGKFLPHIRTWKLRDPITASQFKSGFKLKVTNASAAATANAGVTADTANLETVWSKLKDPLLDAAT